MSNELDTKQRILDSAQYLFAREGFKGTSLRAITNRAEVNLAAINYHFGSKEALLKSVLERHLIPLNKVRMERLIHIRDTARQNQMRPSVSDLLVAFVEPTLKYKDSSQDAGDFIAIIGRAFFDPDDTVRKAFIQLILPLYELIVATFHEALPELSEKVLLWRLHFMFGSISHMMQICGGRFHSDIREFLLPTDTDTILGVLVPFITSGMESSET
jgi:AcrR family transcriptional regulator